ncbi:MAG: AAA family ATPase [Methanomicrobiales archaeon]|nr:AAA family ATPase [Methanomicrobiales archaeon]NYT20517.1 AAA family ATPase [Methanomicrobiales archaeon]
MKPFSVALSGKGGTGKTTVAALLVRSLIAAGRVPVLAVDADPNANLHEALGVKIRETIGGLREEAFTEQIPPGMNRTDYISLRFRKSLVESDGFDLIAMGRPEGSGCYCFANDLLTTSVQLLERDYQFVIIDNEAGMEHIARGTLGIPDLLLIVSDPGARGVRTAIRIRTLARSVGVETTPVLLVLNRWKGTTTDEIPAAFDNVVVIPEDPAIEDADIRGSPVGSLPPGSPARVAVENLAEIVVKMAEQKRKVPRP